MKLPLRPERVRGLRLRALPVPVPGRRELLLLLRALPVRLLLRPALLQRVLVRSGLLQRVLLRSEP